MVQPDRRLTTVAMDCPRSATRSCGAALSAAVRVMNPGCSQRPRRPTREWRHGSDDLENGASLNLIALGRWFLPNVPALTVAAERTQLLCEFALYLRERAPPSIRAYLRPLRSGRRKGEDAVERAAEAVHV